MLRKSPADWRYLFLLAAVCCALRPAAASNDAAAAASDLFVAPGREDMLADMLGRGAALPDGCAFAGGEIGASIRSTYRCDERAIVLELRHPSTTTSATLSTSRFAVVVVSGAPSRALLDALESRIRSREDAFEWSRLPPTPLPAPPQPAPASPPQAETHGSSIVVWAVGAIALLLAGAGVWWLRPAGGGQWLVRAQAGVRDLLSDPLGHLATWPRTESFWVAAIFVAGAVLRGWLCLVNRESNDDHAIVADMIRRGGWLPPPSSACMECSHAKLYHYVLAGAYELLHIDVRLLGNLLNFIAFTALLAVLYAFSRRLRISATVRVLGFAYVSFNPALVGIFSMTTNDGFCILFSSFAIVSLSRFLAAHEWRAVVAATVWTVLAALSKATGWAIFAAELAVLGIAAVAAGTRMRSLFVRAGALFVAGFLLVVPFANPYRENLATRQTPFVNDAFETPVMREQVERLGWIGEAFFTFRIYDLVRRPFIALHEPSYVLHKESLWSQLYGHAVFLRFDQAIWSNLDPRLLWLGRVSLVLGLLPLAALLIGSGTVLTATARGAMKQGRRWFARDTDWQHLVYIAVMLAALFSLIVQYHRLAILYQWMKAIYLLPAVVSFFALFLNGLEGVWSRYPRLVTLWMAAATAAVMVDVAWLIHDLAHAVPS